MWVGSDLQFSVGFCSGVETKNFGGDPRRGSIARGFIGFGEETWGHDDQVVNEGLRNMSRAGRASSWEGL